MTNYLGIKTIELNDYEIQRFYDDPCDNSLLKAITNQYIVIQHPEGKTLPPFVWNGNKFTQVEYQVFHSYQIGDTKPLHGDPYQICYMDSLSRNQLTVATGSAGSGKTLLAVAYAMQEVSKGNASRLYVFSNPVPVKGAQRLGFYPGNRNEKLLESQTGSILCSKLGDETVIQMLAKGQIKLMPLVDCRGLQTDPDSICLFSECQNTDIYLMKLFLQRIDSTSKVILDGDWSQTDDDSLFGNGANGLRRVIDVFAGEDYFGHIPLKNIYRSKIGKKAEEM